MEAPLEPNLVLGSPRKTRAPRGRPRTGSRTRKQPTTKEAAIGFKSPSECGSQLAGGDEEASAGAESRADTARAVEDQMWFKVEPETFEEELGPAQAEDPVTITSAPAAPAAAPAASAAAPGRGPDHITVRRRGGDYLNGPVLDPVPSRAVAAAASPMERTEASMERTEASRERTEGEERAGGEAAEGTAPAVPTEAAQGSPVARRTFREERTRQRGSGGSGDSAGSPGSDSSRGSAGSPGCRGSAGSSGSEGSAGSPGSGGSGSFEGFAGSEVFGSSGDFDNLSGSGGSGRGSEGSGSSSGFEGFAGSEVFEGSGSFEGVRCSGGTAGSVGSLKPEPELEPERRQLRQPPTERRSLRLRAALRSSKSEDDSAGRREAASAQPQPQPQPQPGADPPDRKLHACPVCGQRYWCKATLQKHCREAHSSSLYRCFVCRLQFRSQNGIRRHDRLKHACGACGKMTWRKSEYIHHMATHRCDRCGRIFMSTEALRQHRWERHMLAS